MHIYVINVEAFKYILDIKSIFCNVMFSCNQLCKKLHLTKKEGKKKGK